VLTIGRSRWWLASTALPLAAGTRSFLGDGAVVDRVQARLVPLPMRSAYARWHSRGRSISPLVTMRPKGTRLRILPGSSAT
jgi:hypothetical protein